MTTIRITTIEAILIVRIRTSSTVVLVPVVVVVVVGLLPRSTISEVLAQSVKIGIVGVTKKQGLRIKLYQPAISFTDLMLGNYDLVARHISEVMPRLSDYTMMVKRTRSKSKETKKFLKILKSLEKAYAFTRDYSNAMKAEMVKRLKEEYDRGFVFI